MVGRDRFDGWSAEIVSMDGYLTLLRSFMLNVRDFSQYSRRLPPTWHPDPTRHHFQGRIAMMENFVGFYQSFESSLDGPQLDRDTVSYYRESHGLIKELWGPQAGRLRYGQRPKILVSPYFDSTRRRGDRRSVEAFKGGLKTAVAEVLATDIDIIAPQDGAGSGLSAVFHPWQRGELVSTRNPYLEGIENQSLEERYFASTADLFRWAREEMDRIGSSARLWGNFEAFRIADPGTSPDREFSPCLGSGRNGLSCVRRMRHLEQIAAASRFTSGVLTFHWDGLLDRVHPGVGKSYAQAVLENPKTPVVNEVFEFDSSHPSGSPESRGIIVRGFNLNPTTEFGITWYNERGELRYNQMQVQALQRAWHSNEFSQNTSRFDEDTSEVFLPFADFRQQRGEGSYLHVRARQPGKNWGPQFSIQVFAP